MPFQALRGTTDILWNDVPRWSAVERTARRLTRLYGYHELRTPILEDAALFLRSIGETSDIVQKEMFRFADRGGQDIVLRPEGTAPVVRAYLEHELHKAHSGVAKLFYLGPMFRAERPQKGRYRQFHQFGVEAIGSNSPWVDVEAITLCWDILQACGVTDASVWVASMGSREDQQRSAERLRERLSPHRATLCKDCQARFAKNVFRVLDCKNPTCHELAWSQPGSPFTLSAESAARFDQVRRGLSAGGVPFDDTKVFARGLDYYTHTVFEVRAKGLGAQDAVAAGGRYDHLVEEFGGPALGAVGFAAGIERVLLASASQEPSLPGLRGVYLAVAQPDLLLKAMELVRGLRARGVEALIDYEGKSLKAQLRQADKSGYRLVAILGPQEVARQAITVKDLGQDGQAQETVPLDRFVDTVTNRLKERQAACHHP